MTSNGWKEVTLGEISLDGKGSYGIAASAVEYSDDLYTYLRITDINDDGTLNKTDLKSVDDEKAEKYLLQPNDIVFARTGNSTGRSYFYDGSDGELVYAGFLIKFSLDPSKVNPKFMRYYTLSNEYKGWVSSYISGSTRGNINAKTYANMKISLPPRKQQDYLVKVLSSLDEKIKTNNQINEKLEEMAQALFKHWFVDFEFPNENGEPYKSSGGEMVESELGMIPKGWEVGKLGDIISISSGKRPKEKQADSSEKYPFPIVGASSIMGYTSDFNYNEPVLIIGRVGTHGIIQRFTNKVWASDNTLVIKSKYYGFTYNILKSIDYKSLNRGSTQPLITQKDIKNTTVLIPPSNVVNSYEDFYSSLFEKYRTNKVESDLLTKIRDSILPKLMSGEIRVPLDNEELVEQS
ncbi:restriction endonuclease subunit S [Bacillus methanolicus]|uniref:restriction endonuclease subunit S n=1 Tax=Bacillus methanolicus TaxID=1471 RepID=UPI002380AE83|nr:restriction endonuclease subunit S [Bacillus methanolicus]MDE3840447.1 restriction endonuclease subunit S [Bacillus methanolicus]